MQTEILKKIGLTDGEIKAYLAVIELGSSSTGPIATKSGVSRSKLYGIFDKLSKKGLASYVDRGGVRYFQAVEPSKIRGYIRKKQEEMKMLEDEFEGYLPELQKHYKNSKGKQKVTLFQGLAGLKVVYEHIFLKLKKGEEYVLFGVPDFPDWIELKYWQKYHARRQRAGIKARMLYNVNVAKSVLDNRNAFKNCDARYLPTDIVTPAYTIVYKDTAVTVVPSDEPLCIEVSDQRVADAYMAHFEEYWKKSKKLV